MDKVNNLFHFRFVDLGTNATEIDIFAALNTSLMKNFLRITSGLFAVVIIFSNTSCKKNSTDPICRISKVVQTTGTSISIITLKYDEKGRIISNIITGADNRYTNYAYNGNNIHITGSSALDEFIVVLDDYQKVKSVIELRGNDTGGTGTYYYGADGNFKSYSFMRKGDTVSTSPYFASFLNGDMTYTSEAIYTYYLDRPFIDGDVFKTQQIFTFGALHVINSHLVKSKISDTDTTNYIYDFDNSGKITKQTWNNNHKGQFFAEYTYTCQ